MNVENHSRLAAVAYWPGSVLMNGAAGDGHDVVPCRQRIGRRAWRGPLQPAELDARIRSGWLHPRVRPSVDRRRASDGHARADRPDGAGAGSRFLGFEQPASGALSLWVFRSIARLSLPPALCARRCRWGPTSAVPAGQGTLWSIPTSAAKRSRMNRCRNCLGVLAPVP